MPTLKLILEYLGTSYYGWQRQPGRPTIQEELERCLAIALREPVRAQGAARTDAGVHALGQVVSAVTAGPVEPGRLARSLNALLPDDIAVRRVEVMPDSFHARHSARGRIYRYRIALGDFRSPFLRETSAWSRARLDEAAMDQAARQLEGEHDFSSFRASGDQAESPVKIIRSSRVARAPETEGLLRYTVEGSSFLRHMVRAIAGTLMEVGRGRRSACRDDPHPAGAQPRRCRPHRAGAGADAHGSDLPRPCRRPARMIGCAPLASFCV